MKKEFIFIILFIYHNAYAKPVIVDNDGRQLSIRFDDGRTNVYKINGYDEFVNVYFDGNLLGFVIGNGSKNWDDINYYFIDNHKLISFFELNSNGKFKNKYYDTGDIVVSECCVDSEGNLIDNVNTKKLFDSYLSIKHYTNKKLSDINFADAAYLTHIGREKPEEVNNLGYSLYKAGFYHPAGVIFQGILNAHPTRVVVYLNLADNLWAEGDKEPARKNLAKPLYKKYISMMSGKNKKDKIPAYVYERIK